jgi:hypothetical protein
MYRFRQSLNVFAGITQGAERTAIRSEIGISKARDHDITRWPPIFWAIPVLEKTPWAAFVDTASEKIRFGCAARKFSRGERRRSMSALHMSQRTRIHHEISFGQRLANEAKRAREVAVTLPDGKKRDALFEKARLADLAARINGWLAPPN